jgi:uncharacterized protein (TIGR03086 family)
MSGPWSTISLPGTYISRRWCAEHPGRKATRTSSALNPSRTFRTTAASLTTALGAPGVLDRVYALPIGQVSGLGLIEIRLIEHLGHGWDLARASGQLAPFSDDLAERGLAVARHQVENRRAGAHSPYGAAVEVSPDATAIDRLAGFLGRAV